MAPSRHDWKIVDWDVKPQHNQPTVHLYLFLFESHGNKEYVRALACMRACVRTYLYVWSDLQAKAPI